MTRSPLFRFFKSAVLVLLIFMALLNFASWLRELKAQQTAQVEHTVTALEY